MPAGMTGPGSQSPYQQALPLCSVSPGKRCPFPQGRSLMLGHPLAPACDTKGTKAGKSARVPRESLTPQSVGHLPQDLVGVWSCRVVLSS